MSIRCLKLSWKRLSLKFTSLNLDLLEGICSVMHTITCYCMSSLSSVLLLLYFIKPLEVHNKPLGRKFGAVRKEFGVKVWISGILLIKAHGKDEKIGDRKPNCLDGFQICHFPKLNLFLCKDQLTLDSFNVNESTKATVQREVGHPTQPVAIGTVKSWIISWWKHQMSECVKLYTIKVDRCDRV